MCSQTTSTAAPPAPPHSAQDGDIYVARAPGRLDVLGGIADYCGSLVLQVRELGVMQLIADDQL